MVDILFGYGRGAQGSAAIENVYLLFEEMESPGTLGFRSDSAPFVHQSADFLEVQGTGEHFHQDPAGPQDAGELPVGSGAQDVEDDVHGPIGQGEVGQIGHHPEGFRLLGGGHPDGVPGDVDAP